MRFALILVAVVLTSCTSKAEEAKKQYEFVRDHGGSAVERCAAATKTYQAFLDARDSAGYNEWKLTSSIECATAARESQS